MKPRFTKTAEGLLLSGYDATSDSSTTKTAVTVAVEYRMIEGLQVISKLHLNGWFQATVNDEKSPFDIELAFDQYKIEKK